MIILSQIHCFVTILFSIIYVVFYFFGLLEIAHTKHFYPNNPKEALLHNPVQSIQNRNQDAEPSPHSNFDKPHSIPQISSH